MRVFFRTLVCSILLVLATSAGAGQAATARQIHAVAPTSTAVARASASAPATTTSKKLLGVVPHRGAAPAASAAAPFGGRTAPGLDFPATTGSLLYHGGRVMHSSTVYTVFWDPTTLPAGVSHFGPNYVSLINQFVSDIGTDSPNTTNVFGSDAQYTDTTTGHITGTIGYGGTYTDTTSMPASLSTRFGCSAPAPCITDTQLETELRSVINAHGWPTHTFTSSYAIMTPPGLNVCIDWASDPFGNAPCSTDTFCAYHTWGDLPAPPNDPIEIYAVEPSFDYGTGCDLTPAGYPQGPNGDIADITISTLSHELNEDITDPTQGGWWDASGQENGDKCAYNYGYRVGSTADGDYNQVINGHPYLLQREWSNTLNGCYQNGAPSITNFAPTSTVTGDTVTINGKNFFWACSTIGNPCFMGGAGTPVVKFNGIASPSVNVISPTQLTAVVPNGNATGKITVLGTITGTATSATNFGLKPTITGLSVSHGFTGSVVHVTGTGFVNVTSVKFNGVAGAFSAVTSTGLNVTVPAAATTGALSVTTIGGQALSNALGGPGIYVVDSKITSFAPLSASVGGTVTLTGSGFGASGESRTITVGSVAALLPGMAGRAVAASVMWVSPNSVKFTVPAGATTNPITVSVGSSGAAPFTTAGNLKILPKVTGYDVNPAREGDAVTIQGSTLDGATSVKFGAVSQPSFTVAGDGNSITTTVPVGAVTGSVTVVTPGGTSIGPSFKVLPTVDESFAPTEGLTGTHVVITGKTFAGTTAVKVGGVLAPFTRVGNTITATVPAAAVTGPITVTNAGGPSTTAGTFTVDPKITSFAPLSAAVGGTVTLTGSGFGASGETRSITVNSVPALGPASGRVVSAAVTWVSPNSVKFNVPAGATTGVLAITVGSAAPFATAAQLRVVPKVTGYDVNPAREGDAVTIQGSTLDGATSVKFGTVSQPTYSVAPDGTAISTTVPVGAITGLVTVVTPGGTSIGPSFRVSPTVDESFAPTHGAAGTHVTITGKTFAGTTSVKFGGVVAAFTRVGNTITATVPTGALTGGITVTNAGGATTTSGAFTVDPKITSFSPLSGPTGTTVTISGSGFGGADLVTFGGGKTSTPTSVTPTMVKAVVPPGATTGQLKVHTPAGDSPLTATAFTVTFGVTNISPTSGDYGTDVTIDGVGLTGLTAVKFNGIAGAIQSGGSATQLHVHAPASGTITGHVTLCKGAAGTPPCVQAPQDFTYTPPASPATLQINELSPNLGSSQDLVELKAVSGGSINGMKLVAFPSGSSVTLATLPNVTVATGDFIVVHLNPPAGVTDETATKSDCTDTACYSTAWDVRGGITGLTYGDEAYALETSGNTVQDGVAFVDATSGTDAIYRADLTFLQGLGAWLPADCGGSACTDATTPTAEGVSASWAGMGTTPTGNDAQRSSDGDTNQASDWTVAASTLGATNGP